MEILEYDVLESTQTFLIGALKDSKLQAPVCIICRSQTQGIGSRGNTWEHTPNALYFSFALPLELLPHDLRLESASIFFGYILKQNLQALGSKVWLKWPNDLYVERDKVGGVLSTKIQNTLVCGIGVNLFGTHRADIAKYGTIEKGVSTNIDKKTFVQNYLQTVEKTESWKQIFRFYQLEFESNFAFSFHHQGRELFFKDARLLEDGSICVDSQVIYSLR